MRIIINTESDVNLVQFEKDQISAFIHRMGFKVRDVIDEEDE